MLVIAALLLWIAAIVLHTVVYHRRALRKPNYNPDLLGTACSGIAGGLLTYAIRPGGTVRGAYAYYVNGSRVSSGGMIGMQVIVVWVVFTAVFNLSAKGLGYLISKKFIDRE